MGIERTWQAIDKANVVLWVVDVTSADTSMAHDILARCEGKALIAILNKTDLDDDVAARSELNDILPKGTQVVAISAKSESDIESLRNLIVETASMPDVDSDAVIVTNARHYQALTHARDAIARAIDGLDSGLSGDLLDQDIRECLHWLGEITGEITTDAILGEIFTHFCVGK
jgi:tRNA modification GTPase